VVEAFVDNDLSRLAEVLFNEACAGACGSTLLIAGPQVMAVTRNPAAAGRSQASSPKRREGQSKSAACAKASSFANT